MAKISVIVTVFNIEKYLPRFFKSMADQSFKDYQILIFDDGSTDGSLQLCNNYAQKDERIKVFHLDHIGISAARNYSMQYIDTEYAVHADGDDYVEPDYLLHLITAIEKYDADWAISRVAYKNENCEITEGVFPAYGEKCIARKDFDEWLPRLFEDRRFNYLYGKIYRSEFFKTLRVEPDVMQGSDTMINCGYIAKINSIVLIDDIDYNYIKYGSRSVTSYAGDQAFARLLRINNFIYSSMGEQGLLSEQMKDVIAKRILLGAVWVTDRIKTSDIPYSDKVRQIDEILSSSEYVRSYDYIKTKKIDTNFDIIPLISGDQYLKDVLKQERSLKCKAKILKICPQFVKNIYRKLKNRK